MWTRTRFRSIGAFAIALSLGLATAHARAAPDENDDDPSLVQFRERFKQGLDRYEANDVAGALSYWEPLYRDLGPSRGYRVGYNLARAYEVVGDSSRAAERYQSFLDEVKSRRDAGLLIDDIVAADEAKAKSRIEEIARTRARIRVPPTTPPESVRVDQSEPRLAGFVAYVAPGAHDVVFAPDTPRAHTEHVDVQAGQILDVVAPKIEEPKIVATRRDDRSAWIAPEPTVLKRPFAPGWLWAAGIATLVVGGGATIGAYTNAIVVHDHYASQPVSQGPTQAQVNDYDNARTLAYASWAVPATLAVLTAVLTVWYATGARRVIAPKIAVSF